MGSDNLELRLEKANKMISFYGMPILIWTILTKNWNSLSQIKFRTNASPRSKILFLPASCDHFFQLSQEYAMEALWEQSQLHSTWECDMYVRLFSHIYVN